MKISLKEKIVIVLGVSILISTLLGYHFAAAAKEAPGLRPGATIDASKLATYNSANIARLQTVIERSKAIKPDSSFADVGGAVCGPAALFATLGAQAPSSSFPEWIAKMRTDGTFRDGKWNDRFLVGMKPRDIEAALKGQGLDAKSFQLEVRGKLASRAIAAVDEGRAVFAEVNAADSYRAIAHEVFPADNARHIVGVVAAQRDQSGKVSEVGIYDVNVYSGDPLVEIPARFVPYPVFVEMLGIVPGALVTGIVVSDQPVRHPVLVE
jgi:hypothetical protein